jgi:predicted transcriptional regulator
MKTAISIPDGLFEAAERLAAQLGVSRSRLFQMAIAAFLEEHRQDRVTEALDGIYGSGGERAEVDAVLKHLQGASIAREDW